MNLDLDLLRYRVGCCLLMSFEDIFVPKDFPTCPYDAMLLEMSLLKGSSSNQQEAQRNTLQKAPKELRLNCGNVCVGHVADCIMLSVLHSLRMTLYTQRLAMVSWQKSIFPSLFTLCLATGLAVASGMLEGIKQQRLDICLECA